MNLSKQQADALTSKIHEEIKKKREKEEAVAKSLFLKKNKTQAEKYYKQIKDIPDHILNVGRYQTITLKRVEEAMFKESYTAKDIHRYDIMQLVHLATIEAEDLKELTNNVLAMLK